MYGMYAVRIWFDVQLDIYGIWKGLINGERGVLVWTNSVSVN